jgi:hypothetical protein
VLLLGECFCASVCVLLLGECFCASVCVLLLGECVCASVCVLLLGECCWVSGRLLAGLQPHRQGKSYRKEALLERFCGLWLLMQLTVLCLLHA